MAIGSFTIGSTPIGGQLGNQNDLAPTSAILTINGVQYATWQDISIQDAVAARGTADVKLVDLEKNIHPQPGQSVTITWNGQLLFAGTIDQVSEEPTERDDERDIIFVSMTCVDWTQLCDRYHVAASYVNKTVLQIVEDIIEVQTGMSLDGVTMGEVDSDLVIQKINFNYTKVATAFRDLAEATGLAWYIDYEKVLHFFDRTTFISMVTIGDVSGVPGDFFPDRYFAPRYFSDSTRMLGGQQILRKYRNLSWSRDRQQYRNRQFIRAGFDLTDVKIEPLPGSASSVAPEKRIRTWPLKYQVGEIEPTDENPTLGIKRGGVAQRLGISGVDKDGDLTVPSASTWPQFFYKVGEKEISQNSEENEEQNPTVKDTEILEVTYRGRFPMVMDQRDAAKVAERQAVEGGSGIYEFVEEDRDLQGRDLAKEKALRLIELYGRIPGQLEFDIDSAAFLPGQLMNVTIADLEIDNIQFLIDRISIRFMGHVLPRVKVTALDGERQQGWADYFRKLAEAGKRTIIRENEVVIKTTNLEEQLIFQDVIQESVHNVVSLKDYFLDPYSWALCGLVTVASSGEEIPMGLVGRSIIGEPYGS